MRIGLVDVDGGSEIFDKGVEHMNTILAEMPPQIIFDYYRESGFPNYEKGDYVAGVELRKVRDAEESRFYSQKVFRKYQSANGFLFSYFPHWIDVKCGKSPTLRESWEDDKCLMELITKTQAYCARHHENWSTNRIRQNAKVYCAKQSVSNFNPVTARILYDNFAYGGVVYDMSMGWGGRLLGFYASGAKTYLGCEPSTKTFAGLRSLDADLKKYAKKETKLICIGSEKVDLSQYCGCVDFAFTSPPYFDTERYSDEPTQSYIAYPTMREWLAHFIKPTFEKAYAALRGGGAMAINYANDKKVTKELILIAEALGFTLEDTLHYELSSIAGAGAKLEPIFIFRKGGKPMHSGMSERTLFDLAI